MPNDINDLVKQQHEGDFKRRVAAFEPELKALIRKHSIELTAHLIYSPEGIAPIIRFVDAKQHNETKQVDSAQAEETSKQV